MNRNGFYHRQEFLSHRAQDVARPISMGRIVTPVKNKVSMDTEGWVQSNRIKWNLSRIKILFSKIKILKNLPRLLIRKIPSKIIIRKVRYFRISWICGKCFFCYNVTLFFYSCRNCGKLVERNSELHQRLLFYCFRKALSLPPASHLSDKLKTKFYSRNRGIS